VQLPSAFDLVSERKLFLETAIALCILRAFKYPRIPCNCFSYHELLDKIRSTGTIIVTFYDIVLDKNADNLSYITAKNI